LCKAAAAIGGKIDDLMAFDMASATAEMFLVKDDQTLTEERGVLSLYQG